MWRERCVREQLRRAHADEVPQARLVITVSVRPYDVNSCNLDFA